MLSFFIVLIVYLLQRVRRRPRVLLGTSSFVNSCTRYTKVRGKTLRVVQNINMNAPVFVFLHGFGGSVLQFSFLMELFSGYSNVVSLDYVGHGASPDTKWY